MGIGLGSGRAGTGKGLDGADLAVRRLEAEWQRGRPDLAAHLEGGGADGPASVSVLAALVKADLGQRFARGERPEVAEYLEQFPALRDHADRVLSLVYEEYCLLEERGERPDTEEFCERYADWRDSLASQLKYHRVISHVIGPTTAQPTFPKEGDRFEQFTIGTEIGRGGAARVYLASDETLGGRDVVLKVSADRGNEPSILGRLEHPHIITVLSVARDPSSGLRGLCMPYRPGLPLDEVIRRLDLGPRPTKAQALRDALVRPRPAPWVAAGTAPDGRGWAGFPARGSYADGVAWVVATLAEALAYAHARKVYHRDVKPANVLLTYHDGPQLLDFNLSYDPDSAEQAEAALRGGTLPYMAPEQLEAFLDPGCWGTVLAPADVYSLGLLARELLTGRPPETPDPGLPLPRAIRGLLDRRMDLNPGPRRVDPRLPFALDSIVARCLAFAPENRYRDAAELADDLRRYLARRPLKHAPNRSTRELVVNWGVRHRAGLAAAFLGLGGLAAAVAAPAVTQTVDHWLTPAEARPDFLRAVGELEAEHPDAALLGLNRLSAEERHRPVAAFYRAVTLGRLTYLNEAYEVLKRDLPSPAAWRTLSGWGADHPSAYTHAEVLGYKLLNARWDGPRRGDEALDLAEKLLRFALEFDPRRDYPRQGLAVIEQTRGRFAVAHNQLSALVAEHEGGPLTTVEARKALRNPIFLRARNWFRWGQAFLHPPGDAPPKPDEAETRFRNALADLDRADPLVEKGDRFTVFALNHLRTEVLLGLGEVASLRGKDDEASRFNDQAEALFETLADHPHEPPIEEAYRELSKKVRERLQAAGKAGLKRVPPAH